MITLDDEQREANIRKTLDDTCKKLKKMIEPEPIVYFDGGVIIVNHDQYNYLINRVKELQTRN